MRRAVLGSLVLLLVGSMPAAGQLSSDPYAATAAHDLATLRVERERAEVEVAALERQHASARQRLRGRVRALYRLRRAGALPLSEGFDSMLRHQSRVQRLERLVGRDARAFRTIGRRVRSLREEAGRLAAEQEHAEQQLVAARARQESQAQQLAVLSQMIEDPAAWSGSSVGDGFGIRLSDPPSLGYRLSDHRGALPLPVGGSAEVRDADREGGAGLELTTRAGVSVRAVGPGRVSYAARHPAYGNLVIVDHGDGHYTIYGGLGVVAVESGTEVAQGTTLGAVGPQPLFFQIRRGTRPLPTRQWLGI